jgi:hypothetical protein
MEENWVKIFESHDEFRVEVARQTLEESGINAVVLDKKDSPFLTGNAELYVNRDSAAEAMSVIKDFLT